jgi:hypothetical protein
MQLTLGCWERFVSGFLSAHANVQPRARFPPLSGARSCRDLARDALLVRRDHLVGQSKKTHERLADGFFLRARIPKAPTGILGTSSPHTLLAPA